MSNNEAQGIVAWVCRKLKLPEDADKGDIYGAMHVMEAHASTYVNYVKTEKTALAERDKRIAELEATVARQQMEALAALENVEAERDALKSAARDVINASTEWRAHEAIDRLREAAGFVPLDRP